MGLEGPSYILAALTAVGGIAGYARTGSLPSVVAGCTVGLLYAAGGYRIQNKQANGPAVCLVASIVLGAASVPRAVRLRKPVPIMLSLIATYGLITFGSAVRRGL